ncbi:hypothetical protein [Thioalkalivibrio sp. ALE23]|uniref:hypothetical protein n=1 Tax=Thioalkalivibrio sp. ALE23 TaxID=1265495 RepID=UPI0003671368|nr:hypothetical protein [Thioalkalivibrio sp. ALE23]
MYETIKAMEVISPDLLEPSIEQDFLKKMGWKIASSRSRLRLWREKCGYSPEDWAPRMWYMDSKQANQIRQRIQSAWPEAGSRPEWVEKLEQELASQIIDVEAGRLPLVTVMIGDDWKEIIQSALARAKHKNPYAHHQITFQYVMMEHGPEESVTPPYMAFGTIVVEPDGFRHIGSTESRQFMELGGDIDIRGCVNNIPDVEKLPPQEPRGAPCGRDPRQFTAVVSRVVRESATVYVNASDAQEAERIMTDPEFTSQLTFVPDIEADSEVQYYVRRDGDHDGITEETVPF